MKHPVIILFTALLLCSCAVSSSSEKTPATAPDTTENANILGEWAIESIVIDDTTAVRPAELGFENINMTFSADSTVRITTNCNSMGGRYLLDSHSISFGSMMQTRMACENMDIETALSKVLPDIETVDVTNDSTIRLNSRDAMPYINLRRITEPEN